MDFVEIDEIVAHCEGFLRVGKWWVEKRRKNIIIIYVYILSMADKCIDTKVGEIVSEAEGVKMICEKRINFPETVRDGIESAVSKGCKQLYSIGNSAKKYSVCRCNCYE